MATLNTIPTQSGEVIRVLLTLAAGAGTAIDDIRGSNADCTIVGDVTFQAGLILDGINPFSPSGGQGDIRLRRTQGAFRDWRNSPGNNDVELRFAASFDGDTVRDGREGSYGGGFWNWELTGLPTTVEADGGDTINLVMNVPAAVIVDVDAAIAARAGSPTATAAVDIAPAPTLNASLTARAGNPTAVLAAAAAPAPIRDATLIVQAGSPAAVLTVVVDGLAIDASFSARAGLPTAPLIAATGRNPYDAGMSRGIPYVPLASAPEHSGITLSHIIAASNLAADRCGWDDDYLIPTVKAWRIPSAKSGPWRYDMGMPVLEAVTPGITIDGHIVQFTATRSGGLEVVAVMGFGWLEPMGRLTQTIGIDTAIIPGITPAPGASYLIGNEYIWYDADSALVRLTPFVHAAGDPIRRVHANATLASAILRLAGRQKDYEGRAGYSSRDAQRPQPGAEVRDFQVMDIEAAQTLQPFIRPSMLSWKRPSNYGLLKSDTEPADISTISPIVDLPDILAAIREGDNIDIDRSIDEQITINADEGGGGGGGGGGGRAITSLYALLADSATEPTVADFLMAPHAFGPVITVPAFAASRWLWFAADQPLRDLRETGSSFSAFSAFEAPVDIVIGGVTHHAYQTVSALNPRAAAVSWTATQSG